MSAPESEISESLTNGQSSTTETQDESSLDDQNYDQPQINEEDQLNNVDNEAKLDSSAEQVEESISKIQIEADEQISTSQVASEEIISTSQVVSKEIISTSQVASKEIISTRQVASEELISSTQVVSEELKSTTQIESETPQETVTSQTEVHEEVIQEHQEQEPLQTITTANTESEVTAEIIPEVKSSEDSEVSPLPKKEDTSSSEIQEEGLRNKLHEIIEEISIEVSQDDENEPRPHTWQPKGNYEVPKTEITYEDIVPCEVPDVQIKEKSEIAEISQKNEKFVAQSEVDEYEAFCEDTRQQYSVDAQKFLRHAVVNGEPLSPQEIPLGIPLLAKLLPREESGDEEPREKIPLERLFTPASDAENLIPLKKKRAFASSCFYRPDHPTIDDQVELAHKISVSLIDENNKSSRGQTMYMKRKNRSSKWIHEGGATQSREAWQQETLTQEEKKSSKEKPQLKLVLSPKKVQDFNAVQKHYEELMATTFESNRHITRMEVGKEIANHLESPTGKGAALFAKRKKRMDKFIVDESTIQQQQQLDQQQQQTINESVTTQHSNFTGEQNSTFLTTESNSIVQENGYQTNHDASFGGFNATDQEAAMYKAEVTLVQNPLSASPALDISAAQFSLHKIINEGDFPAKKEEKRKSFNLAPKGWGTYNNFYTPVHLEAAK